MEYTQVIFEYLNNFSYLALFLLVFFGGIIVPVPEEIIIIATGYFVSQGLMNLPMAWVVIVIALFMSDNLIFRLTCNNNHWMNKFRCRVLAMRIMRYRPYMEKHIDKTIFFCRFAPFMRFVGPILAATIKTSKKDFFIFNTLAVVIYSSIILSIGYFFGGQISYITDSLKKFDDFVFWLIVAIIGFMIIAHINRRLDASAKTCLVDGITEKK